MHKQFLTMTALTLGAALAQAAESIQVAGELTCKTTEQHAVPVEGDPGHVLVVQKVTCSGSATGLSRTHRRRYCLCAPDPSVRERTQSSWRHHPRRVGRFAPHAVEAALRPSAACAAARRAIGIRNGEHET
jgi:hypothetical protein